jgi:hypothetical protein
MIMGMAASRVIMSAWRLGNIVATRHRVLSFLLDRSQALVVNVAAVGTLSRHSCRRRSDLSGWSVDPRGSDPGSGLAAKDLDRLQCNETDASHVHQCLNECTNPFFLIDDLDDQRLVILQNVMTVDGRRSTEPEQRPKHRHARHFCVSRAGRDHLEHLLIAKLGGLVGVDA